MNDPEWEFEDGVRIRRNCGTSEHSELLGALAVAFSKQRKAWNIRTFLVLTFKLRPGKYMIADAAVFNEPVTGGQIPSVPPLIWIEVLSPQDRPDQVSERVKQILAFGAPNVWIINPQNLASDLHTPTGSTALTDGILRIPGTPIEVPLAQVYED